MPYLPLIFIHWGLLMQRLLIVLLVLPMFLIFKPETSSAFYVESVNDPGGVLNGSPYYDANTDQIRIDYFGSKVVQTTHAYNPPEGTVRISDAPSGSWFVATGFTCVGTYDFSARDSSGATVLSMRIVIEEGDLVNPVCNSDNASELPSEETKCATLICECIAELQKPLADINGSLTGISGQITETNTHLTDLKTITQGVQTAVKDLHSEFQTDQVYNPKPMPDMSTVLDQNKPVQPSTPFEDNTNYFTDQGDAAAPGKLPTAPGVKEWDGFTPDLPMPPEMELLPDLQLQPDQELITDSFTKTPELTADPFAKTPELSKEVFNQSPEMTKDVMGQTPEMTKEVMQQEPQMSVDEFDFDNQYQQTHVYEQTNIYP